MESLASSARKTMILKSVLSVTRVDTISETSLKIYSLIIHTKTRLQRIRVPSSHQAKVNFTESKWMPYSLSPKIIKSFAEKDSSLTII